MGGRGVAREPIAFIKKGKGQFTFTFSFPVSVSFFSLNSPSHGLTADGGAMQAHLHSGPDVIVSTV